MTLRADGFTRMGTAVVTAGRWRRRGRKLRCPFSSARVTLITATEPRAYCSTCEIMHELDAGALDR